MIIVDAHQDIAYNAICFDRDYRQLAWRKRRSEVRSGAAGVYPAATLGLPDALIGRVGIVFATLFVAPHKQGLMQVPWQQPTYRTPDEAYRLALVQFDYYQRLADNTDRIHLIRSEADLEHVLATWADDIPFAGHKQGLVLLMEGADPILEPRQFEEWYARGVRIVGPAWSATRYAGGTGAPGPLTTPGYALLDIMAGLNAVLDISHLAEQAALQTLDTYPGAIIASHSNPRRFCNSDRHLSDEVIRRLAEHDGVMGIVPYNAFLSNRWQKGDPPLPLALVADAIDYVCQLTGSARHVGIGTDFDGGFGAESLPEGMDTIGDLLAIAEVLRVRGYVPEDIGAIMGNNMLRLLRRALAKG